MSEQKPVAEVYRAHYGGRARNIGFNSVREIADLSKLPPGTKLYAAPPAQPIETLPLDYLRGFRDGLEWAADLAEAEDPRTSDWMYDDRNDLAEAIRRGPEMPPAQPAEPNMRHPKIQALIGGKARAEIELGLVEQLLEDPNFETTPMDMEHWGPLHDKLKAALTAQPAEPVARVNADGFIVETGLLITPGTLLYAVPPAPAAVPPDERVRVLREALKRHVDHFGDPLQYARAALEATK